MKKIIFFSEDGWALGTIHHALTKLLYSQDILADVLDWSISYRQADMDLIAGNYDYFLTKPDTIDCLTSYGIPLNRIIIVAHAPWDLLLCNQKFGTNIYTKVKAYAVVSDDLRKLSKTLGISRVPMVTPLGVIVDNFYRPVPARLERVGYAGAYVSYNYAGEEIKRGYLAERAVEQAGLIFVNNDRYHYLAMPSFYDSVDAVITSSTEEAGGLPMMEAAAAGRLTIGTPVGYYEANGAASGGVVVPIEGEAFVEAAAEKLRYYKNHPASYKKTCFQIQTYAQQHYDWSKHIAQWVKLFSS